MKIIEFYKKGARVVVEGRSGIDPLTFAPAASGDEDIAYVPSGQAKVVEGAAHDLLVHGGVTYLLLRGGHVYEVTLDIGGVTKEDVVSAEHGHLSLPLPAGAKVTSVNEVEQ